MSPFVVCYLTSTACRTGHADRHARRIGRQWPELIGRFLRRHAYRRGSPTHQRHLVRLLRRGPSLLAVSASEGINILRNTPSILSTLQENVRAIRAVLDRVEVVTIPSHAASPIIDIHLRSAATLSPSAKPPNPAAPAPRDAPSFDIAGEERLVQDIVDEALVQGVWITRARRLGQELVEARPSIRL